MVTLQIHQMEGEKVQLISMEAEEFSDFLIVRLESEQGSPEYVEAITDEFARLMPNKKMLVIDNTVDLTFYGLKEMEDEYEQLELDL